MGIIKLKNIRTFSYHGCLIEEGKIGSDYSVDLEVNTDLAKSALSDQLEDTVDYVLLNRIVEEEMAIRSQLLEHVANRIIKRIFKENVVAKNALGSERTLKEFESYSGLDFTNGTIT